MASFSYVPDGAVLHEERLSPPGRRSAWPAVSVAPKVGAASAFEALQQSGRWIAEELRLVSPEEQASPPTRTRVEEPRWSAWLPPFCGACHCSPENTVRKLQQPEPRQRSRRPGSCSPRRGEPETAAWAGGCSPGASLGSLPIEAREATARRALGSVRRAVAPAGEPQAVLPTAALLGKVSQYEASDARAWEVVTEEEPEAEAEATLRPRWPTGPSEGEAAVPLFSGPWPQRALVVSVSTVSAGVFAAAAGGVLPVAVAAGSMGFALGLLSSILGIRVGRWVN